MWGRRLRKADAPTFAIRASYALAALVALALLLGYFDAMIVGKYANG